MAEEEESKKTGFAKISPVKVEKAMTAAEIEAHKKQLEQYYAGKIVDTVVGIDDSPPTLQPVKPSKIRIYLLALVFIFFWLGVLLSYWLGK